MCFIVMWMKGLMGELPLLASLEPLGDVNRVRLLVPPCEPTQGELHLSSACVGRV